MDALDDACEAQLSQEHDGVKFPIAFLSHTFTGTQRKWSASEQEAYGVYYATAKWNYCLQGVTIIVHNDHKQLAKFLNEKNANNKNERWGLELVTYNVTFEWTSEAQNKAANCLSRLVKLPNDSKATVKMLTATNSTQEAKHHTNTKQPQMQNLPILNLTRKSSHQTSPQ